jgi:hypothetical protein
MKQFQKTLNVLFLILSLLWMLLVNTGCGNSNVDKDTTEKTETKDTTIRQDTVNVDPENFSDPH